jgi:hypothetical protein
MAAELNLRLLRQTSVKQTAGKVVRHPVIIRGFLNRYPQQRQFM